MAGFEFHADLRPFDPIDGEFQYRFSGTFRDKDDEFPTIDVVEMPRYPRGWVVINRLSPFWPAASEFLNSGEGQRAIEEAIRIELAFDYLDAAE